MATATKQIVISTRKVMQPRIAVPKRFAVIGKANRTYAEKENELFGMWKNRKDMENVEQYMQKLRKGRNLC